MAMAGEFEERAEEFSHSLLVKEAAKNAEEMGPQLQLEFPNPTFIKHDSLELITTEKLIAELRRGLGHKTWEAVHEQSWQGKLTSARSEDNSITFYGCFLWLRGWKQCPSHTLPGMFELCQQLLPTRLLVCQKKHTHRAGEVVCRLSNKASESACSPLPLT